MRAKLGLATTLISCLLSTFHSFAAVPEPTSLDPERVERLVGLCKLWAAVKYFHPYLAYRDLDWDAALVAAIPKANQARKPEHYAAAVQGMLASLGDPWTRVVAEAPRVTASPDPKPAGEHDPSYRLTEDKILVITLHHYADLQDTSRTAQRMVEITKEIPDARAILFDLRSAAPLKEEERLYVSATFEDSGIVKLLSSTPLIMPGIRTRMHLGLVAQQPPAGEYESAFYHLDGRRISADPKASDLPIVFLANPQSELPSVALALQAAGKGAIIAEGNSQEAPVVPTLHLELAGGVHARIRLGELVYPDGPAEFRPNVQLPVSGDSGTKDDALRKALSLLRHFRPPVAPRSPLPAGVAPTDKAYPEMAYPSPEFRLLAAFRIWAAIEYFFPYKDLMEEDWDDVLREFIPKMEKAGDALEYHLAVVEMISHIHDTHGFVVSPVLTERFGAPPPIRVRMVEGVPVVTGFRDEEAAKAAGIRIGDVILKVDGEDVQDRIGRYARYVSASTPAARTYGLLNPRGSLWVGTGVLGGPDNSSVVLSVRDRGNRVKEVVLPRKATFRQAYEERTGEIIRRLPGGIGYVDLNRLSTSQVDEMFERLRDTRAIIFDGRGSPRNTAWDIAPRLTEKVSPPAVLFQRPAPCFPADPRTEISGQTLTYSLVQTLPPTDKWRYKGKTVMLIDERTLSQGEHTGLFFEVANGTKFVGSTTSGADGDVTNLVVPGGIVIYFTGQAVRHADGRQLQRIGLIPDIAARPTIRGIQAGRDEVLEKAVQYLQRELKTG